MAFMDCHQCYISNMAAMGSLETVLSIIGNSRSKTEGVSDEFSTGHAEWIFNTVSIKSVKSLKVATEGPKSDFVKKIV